MGFKGGMDQRYWAGRFKTTCKGLNREGERGCLYESVWLLSCLNQNQWMMLTITKIGWEKIRVRGHANDVLHFGQVAFKVLWDIQSDHVLRAVWYSTMALRKQTSKCKFY